MGNAKEQAGEHRVNPAQRNEPPNACVPIQRWASDAGLFTLPPRARVTRQSVADRLAIAELFARYGIAHDEVDRDAMGDAFIENSVLEVSIAGPIFERHVGRETIVNNFAFVASTQTDQRRHAVTNIEISSLTENNAEARAYGIVTAADADGIRVAVSCVYTADLTRGDDGIWRFSRLWIGMDIYTGRAPTTTKGE